MANEYGNYCTLTAVGEGTISEGNLKFVCAANGDVNNGTLFIPTSGKWYWELLIGAFDANNGALGIKSIATVNSIHNLSSTGGYGMYISSNSGLNGHRFENSGTTLPGGGASQAVTFAVDDRMNIAYNADDNKLWYGKNGTFFNFETGATLTVDVSTAQFGSIIDQQYVPSVLGNAGTGGSTFTLNFGAIAFTDTPPSGYLNLSTANLPTPAIINPDDHYYNVLLDHDGSSTATTCTFNLETNAWLAIIKSTAEEKWYWVDSLRGVNNYMSSNATTDETADSNVMSVSGTTLTLGSTLADANYLIEVHKAGAPPSADNSEAAGATPTAGSVKIDGANLGSALAGSIKATRLSSNTTSGFSIILMTGTGSNGTVAHGLSSSPEWVVHKERDPGGNNWATWHTGIANTTFQPLDTTLRPQSSATKWNSTSPTATTYSLGTDTGNNASGATYVTYCWHGVAGYSAFGTYAGKDVDGTPTNDFDGPMVYTGFTPSSILINSISADTDWQWTTEATNPVQGNPNTGFLVANETDAIVTNTTPWDFVSNGAKIRVTSDAQSISDRTYTYCMWGGRPMTSGGINQSRAK